MARLRGMKRVLVTGASGCLGRHVVSVLANRGWEIHGVSTRTQPDDPRLRWHRADLLDLDAVRRVVQDSRATHLLHLAWFVSPQRWPSSPENFRWVQASVELMRQFHRYDGERMVTAGSCLEYDWRYGYCSEALTPCKPHTAYGACKLALQGMTEAFASTTGLSSAWGRIFSIYGPHEHPGRLVPSVIGAILARSKACCSLGEQTRDYLFVEDAADAFVKLLESPFVGTMNVASGRPIPIKELSLSIGRMLGRPDLVCLGAVPAAPTDFPHVAADVSRLGTELNWKPSVDLEAGLAKTIDWWKSRCDGFTQARAS